MTAAASAIVGAGLIALLRLPPIGSIVVLGATVVVITAYGLSARHAWVARRLAHLRPRAIDDVLFREIERARRYEGCVTIAAIRLVPGTDPFGVVAQLSGMVRASDQVLCEDPEQITMVLPGVGSDSAPAFVDRVVGSDPRVVAAAWAGFPDEALTAPALVELVADRLAGHDVSSELT